MDLLNVLELILDHRSVASLMLLPHVTILLPPTHHNANAPFVAVPLSFSATAVLLSPLRSPET
jgi:hypothetical protein